MTPFIAQGECRSLRFHPWGRGGYTDGRRMDEGKRRGWEAQMARLREASPDEKLQAAAEQRRISSELLRAGLRARFPDLDEEAIAWRQGELTFGPDVWREICERRQRRRLRHPAT